MKMEQLEQLVLIWAEQQNPMSGRVLENHITKLLGGYQELIDAVDEADQFKVLEALGFILVDVAIAANLMGKDLSACLAAAYLNLREGAAN